MVKKGGVLVSSSLLVCAALRLGFHPPDLRASRLRVFWVRKRIDVSATRGSSSWFWHFCERQ